MYLYVNRESGRTFWSQEGPSEGDLALIEECALKVYCNYGGTFVQLGVTAGEVSYTDVAKGRQVQRIATGEIYTLQNKDVDELTSGYDWKEVPPAIPIGPSGMKPSP